MARPVKCRCICSKPRALRFTPDTEAGRGSVTIGFDEYEAFRLLNLEKKTQAQCAARMNVSRSTVARLSESAGEKLARAMFEGRGIEIGGGDVVVCEAPRPECAGEAHCCHRIKDLEEKA